MGKIRKPAYQQGKVNLSENQKLPLASGEGCRGPRWCCSLETLQTRLNKSLANIERDSLENMEWDMVLLLQVNGCENLISYFNQAPWSQSCLDLPFWLCNRFLPCFWVAGKSCVGQPWGQDPVHGGCRAEVLGALGTNIMDKEDKSEVTAMWREGQGRGLGTSCRYIQLLLCAPVCDLCSNLSHPWAWAAPMLLFKVVCTMKAWKNCSLTVLRYSVSWLLWVTQGPEPLWFVSEG